MENVNMELSLATAISALELIAQSVRPDGTYNRDRKACEQLAKETLTKLGIAGYAPKAKPRVSPSKARQTSLLPEAAQSTLSSGPFVAYSDGGCKGNPGPAGWGVVLTENGNITWSGGGFIGNQTNQIAELSAAIEALSRIPEGAQVELVSDSQYVLKGLTEWRAGWERKNWMNSAGQPVANQSYWKKLFALADKRKVKTKWVRGHTGHPMNELCDQLATKAIEKRETLRLE